MTDPEYKLVEAYSIDDLGRKVSAAMVAGWKPYGNPIIVDREGEHVEMRRVIVTYYQAMTRAPL